MRLTDTQRIGATMYRSPGAPRRALEEADDQPNLWYHLTDRARFRLDPRFAPEDNAIAIVDRSGRPGIYIGQDVERWVNGYNYWRPFVVEFDVDPSVVEDPGVHGRYGGEMFVPATSFDKLTILRVIPIDAHAREVFGEAGWIILPSSPERLVLHAAHLDIVGSLAAERLLQRFDLTGDFCLRARGALSGPASAEARILP